MDTPRRLKDMDDVEPNFMDMPVKRVNRDINNSAPEIKTPYKRPETAQKWGVRD